jgi:hypothetical protein
LKDIYLLIDLSYLASSKTLSRVAIANAIEPQQNGDFYQAETCLLGSLHALQLFQRLRAVIPKAAGGPWRLWQQTTSLVIAHRFDAYARSLGKAADRHLRPRHGLH